MRKCERCGTIVDSITNFCPECGSTMIVDVEPEQEITMDAVVSGSTEQSSVNPEQTPDSQKLEKEDPKTIDHFDRKNKFALLRSNNIFWSIFAMDIPVIGLILAIIWSFGIGVKAQRRELARAYLLRGLVIFVAFLLALALYRWVFRLTLNDLPRVISQTYEYFWNLIAGWIGSSGKKV